MKIAFGITFPTSSQEILLSAHHWMLGRSETIFKTYFIFLKELKIERMKIPTSSNWYLIVWFRSVLAMPDVVSLGTIRCEASGIESNSHWSTC